MPTSPPFSTSQGPAWNSSLQKSGCRGMMHRNFWEVQMEENG